MKYPKYNAQLLKKLQKRDDVTFATHKLKYKKGEFDFWRIQSKKISKKDKIILITASIHGEEVAGALSILNYLDKIFDAAHQAGLKLIVYPVCNPSGFQNGSRYNIDNDPGEAGNNDFMTYELENGELSFDLKEKNEFKRWFWSSDPKIKQRLPLETKFIHKLLKKEPLRQIVASIDLHQDYLDKDQLPATYFYTYGNTQRYKKIVKKIEKKIKIWKHKPIDEGAFASDPVTSDELGFIDRHDCTITDLFYRLGAKHCLAIETTGGTPIETAMEINLIWILEIIKLIET